MLSGPDSDSIWTRERARGFTLIELVITISIVGILAAVAMARFVDLRTDAANGTAQAVAGAVSAGTAMNYAKLVSGGGAVAVQNGTACATLAGFLDGGLDAGLSMAGAGVAGCTGAGTISTSCAVQHAQGTAGGFAVQAICTN